MSAEDRAAALARVQRAIEEWRRGLDVLLRLKAALEHGAAPGVVQSAATELRAARRSAGAAARDAQQRLGAPSSGPTE